MRVISSLFILLVIMFPAVAEKRTFALVPKYMNHPFFNLARDGCNKAAEELDVTCLFIGPAEPDEQGQLQVIQDLITRRVDGIAVSPANAPAMARIIKMANSAKIPVVTWDSDFLPSDRSLRQTYIGTKNYDMGVAMAKELLRLKPQGGTLVIQSGGAAAANLNERIDGIRDTLKGHNWKELEGTPLYDNGDPMLAIKQMEDILAKVPHLDAFIPIAIGPQLVQNAYRGIANKFLSRINSRELIIIASDTLPMQMELLRDGLSHALVGQRPAQMGHQAIVALNDISSGKTVQDPIHTGLDVCTKDTVDSCTKP